MSLTPEREPYSEEKAIAEIKALSSDARYHLQHVFRNKLQILSGMAETGEHADISNEISTISNELRRLDL